MSIESEYQRLLVLTDGSPVAAALLVLAGRVGTPEPTTKPLAVADVAKRLGIAPEKVRQWCRSGRLPATNVGSAKRPRFVIDADDLREFMRVKPASPTKPALSSLPAPKSTRF